MFVMLAIAGDPSSYGQGGAVEVETIRNRYNRSGLYPVDDPTNPIWTVDWYAFTVFLSTDGRYLARVGPWPFSPNYDELALAFYDTGREIKTYQVDDLVLFPPFLPHSISHYGWLKDISLNPADNTLSVQTYGASAYKFDMASGSRIQGVSPLIYRLMIALVALSLIAVLIYRQLELIPAREKHTPGNQSVESLFELKWVVVNLLGLVVTAALIFPLLYRFLFGSSLATSMFVVALSSAAQAYVQGRLFQRYIPIRGLTWIRYNLSAGLLAALLTMSIEPLINSELVFWVFITLVFSGTMGMVQWSFLRQYLPYAGWWLPASFFGYAGLWLLALQVDDSLGILLIAVVLGELIRGITFGRLLRLHTLNQRKETTFTPGYS